MVSGGQDPKRYSEGHAGCSVASRHDLLISVSYACSVNRSSGRLQYKLHGGCLTLAATWSDASWAHHCSWSIFWLGSCNRRIEQFTWKAMCCFAGNLYWWCTIALDYRRYFGCFNQTIQVESGITLYSSKTAVAYPNGSNIVTNNAINSNTSSLCHGQQYCTNNIVTKWVS